jgi:transcriptional regulator with XRE-family HTH domain
MSDLINNDDVLRRQLEDPGFHTIWERTAVARAVALRIVAYRAEHGLSQAALARKLRMKQPAIARLEAGEHNPSLDMLLRLYGELEVEFLLDITPKGRDSKLVSETIDDARIVERATASDGSQVLVAAS